ncbi:acetyltransferase [Deinococcus antarcticus]|uniref:Acetyltransferase n=1 Tax=Deinococcus antarcticus TaxID=1298767 RepID=A0ABV8ABX2_9DEIO
MSGGLHVLGAGGHAKVIVELAQAAGWRVAGIYDDGYLNHPGVLGHAVIGALADVPDKPGVQAVIAIGGNRVRFLLDRRFKALDWVTLVHPFSWISPTVHLEPGAVVMAGAVIHADAHIGRHVIVNTSASVDHDCSLGNYVHIAPGCHLAGDVTISDGSFLGAGTTVIPGCTVGEWSIVGAGAVVARTLPANVTAVGAPAKPIKEREPGWHEET